MKILPNILFIFLLTISCAIYAQTGNSASKPIDEVLKTKTNDILDYIAINQIWMYFTNSGSGSYNSETGGAGLYWPGGVQGKAAAVFRDGLVWGGIVNGQVSAGGNTYREGLQAGRIINGSPDDPASAKYRIYKIRKGWQDLSESSFKQRLKKDWEEWPVEDGAPWIDKNRDGIFTAGTDEPMLIGDETNWMVMNDMDSWRTTFLFGTQPLGLEIQSTVYGYNQNDTLENVVFKKYKIINKGNTRIDSMFLGYWSDPDLGDGNDDYAGCDTLLSLAYSFNGTSYDKVYGEDPPAAGYDLLQGPVIDYNPSRYPVISAKNLPDSAYYNGRWNKGKTNLPMTSFNFCINSSMVYPDPDLGTPGGARQLYNNLNGKIWDGSFLSNPQTGNKSKYPLSGDPVSKNGWYEGEGWPYGPAPGDRRILLSSGPFTFAPGDTQEVTIAIMMARGTDNISCIRELRKTSIETQKFFNNVDFTSGVERPVASVKEYSLEQNYPNPFNPSTTIKYSVAESRNVELKVFDILGNEIATLVNGYKNAGNYSVEFNASKLSSGIYFYTIKAGNFIQTKKLVFLK